LTDRTLGPESQQLETCQLIEILAWSITDYEHSSYLPTGPILDVMAELTAAVMVNPEFRCHEFRCFSKILVLPRNFEACHWSAVQARQYFDLARPWTYGIPSERDSGPERLLTILHFMVVIKDVKDDDIKNVVDLCISLDVRTSFFRHSTQLFPQTLASQNRPSGWDVVYSTRLIIRLESLLKRLEDHSQFGVLMRVGNLIMNVISYNIHDSVITALINQIHQREVDYGDPWSQVRVDNHLPDYLLLIHEVKYWVAQQIPLPDDDDNISVVSSVPSANRLDESTEGARD
jgi:hypothetical protein